MPKLAGIEYTKIDDAPTIKWNGKYYREGVGEITEEEALGLKDESTNQGSPGRLQVLQAAYEAGELPKNVGTLSWRDAVSDSRRREDGEAPISRK